MPKEGLLQPVHLSLLRLSNNPLHRMHSSSVPVQTMWQVHLWSLLSRTPLLQPHLCGRKLPALCLQFGPAVLQQ